MFFGQETFEIEGIEGRYFEKPNIVDKYLRRSEELQAICLAQFARMYKPSNTLSKKQQIAENHKQKLLEAYTDDEFDSEDSLIKAKNTNEIINDDRSQCLANDEEDYDNVEDNLHKLITINGIGPDLPTVVCIKELRPNEPKYMKKMTKPSAIRFFKASPANDFPRYVLNELMLYVPFTQKMYEKW